MPLNWDCPIKEWVKNNLSIWADEESLETFLSDTFFEPKVCKLLRYRKDILLRFLKDWQNKP